MGATLSVLFSSINIHVFSSIRLSEVYTHTHTHTLSVCVGEGENIFYMFDQS